MADKKFGAKGFTLIAALLLLLILSGISVGLLMMVNTEQKVNTQDAQANMSFHAAEGGIEHMTADIENLFQNYLSPTVSQIEALSALAPANTLLVSYPLYTLTPATNAQGLPAYSWGQIATGTFAGLYAQLLPISLQVISQGPLGDEVNMSRTVEMAMIPVFQMGVFSDSDMGFFNSPNLNFAGRVHTNGDLYLGVECGYTLTFHTNLSAYGNVIRAVLPNGLSATSYCDTGNVMIPTASGGCDGTQPNCRALTQTEGSVTGAGGDPPQSSYNSGPPSWQTISLNYYNGYIRDGDYGNATYGTGATDLNLPFVGGTSTTNSGPQPFEIIRRPPTGENPTSLLGASRLYNEAQIHVLLSDTPADLPGGAADANNIRLANFNDATNGVNYTTGVATSVVAGMPNLPAGHYYTTYFATATTGVADPDTYSGSYNQTSLPPDWLYQPLAPLAGYVTLYDLNAPVMVSAGDGSGLTKAPTTTLTLSQCNPSTPVNVPPNSVPVCPGAAAYPYYTPVPYPTLPNANTAVWNLIDGYIRVEYKDSAGNWHPVTAEWLGLGFARGLLPPAAPQTNPVNPNAILLFQEPADRNEDGVIDATGAPPGYTTSSCGHGCTTYTPYPGKPPEVTNDTTTSDWRYGDGAQVGGTSATQFNWYPINFYDAREGEPRDAQQATNSCTANGVMNAVELDVGNLAKWLNGTTGVSGTNVDYLSENGYILYFSDRRGMLPNPNGTQVDPANTKTGDSGLEDSVNRASAAGTPDGVLDPDPPGKSFSDEDVNLNNALDNFGSWNMGLGLGYIGAAYNANNNVNRQITGAAPAPNPYLRMASCAIAQNNWVSGARHVLRLVDGSLGNVPVRPDNNAGGFTVGSENPVYILGNYNTSSADPIWGGGADVAHSAAGIIADAATMLSNNWLDTNSTNKIATQPNPYRQGANTYYRVAIAAGKNINFPFPAWENSTDYGFGTDGGVHNFLRFLEDWATPGATLNYEGSLVSLYYSTYNTGTFKCCQYSVYEPPIRNYVFDPDFTTPQNLPPGTPVFRDVDNLSFTQSFTPHTGSY